MYVVYNHNKFEILQLQIKAFECIIFQWMITNTKGFKLLQF